LVTPLHLRAASAATEAEYKVKGGYLSNFGNFVDWPASAFSSRSSPFIIAVMDGNDAPAVLEQVFAGKSIAGHPVQVRTVSSTPRDAHILLVTRTAGRSPEDVRGGLGGAPTLLVGETEQFAERGGIIGFVRDGENIRITLCLEHAAAAGLKVSARLATVAKAVKSKRGR